MLRNGIRQVAEDATMRENKGIYESSSQVWTLGERVFGMIPGV